MANTFKNYPAKNVGTSAATVLTASASTTVIGLVVSNTSTATITTDVYMTSGGVDYYIIKGAVVPVGTAVVPVGGDMKVVLETGDALKVVTSAASSADVIASVLEIS